MVVVVTLDDLVFNKLLSWRESQPEMFPRKSIPDKPSPTTESYHYILSPKVIRLVARLTLSERSSLLNKQLAGGTYILSETGFQVGGLEMVGTHVVWIDSINPRFTQTENEDSPWLTEITLIEVNSEYAARYFRKSHMINQAPGAGDHYQVKIIVHRTTGIDGGEDVYVNTKCRPDFGDIRFTDSNLNLLDYWRGVYDGDKAVFWVEIAGDLSGSDQMIYIYYGNPPLTTTSNGDATFLFFDDFESGNFNKWSGYGLWQIVTDMVKEGKYAAYHPGTSPTGLYKTMTINYDCMIHVWARTTPALTQQRVVNPIIPMGNTGYFVYSMIFDQLVGGTGYVKYRQDAQRTDWPQNNIYSPNTWVELECGYHFEGVSGFQRGWKNGEYMGQIPCRDYRSNWVTSLSSLRIHGGNNTEDKLWIDAVFLRKWVYVEPSHAAWGNEEIVSTWPS